MVTDKEYDIFWLLNEGDSYKEIGNVLHVTENRVKQIFDRMLSKVTQVIEYNSVLYITNLIFV